MNKMAFAYINNHADVLGTYDFRSFEGSHYKADHSRSLVWLDF